jgi:hypothetical protein
MDYTDDFLVELLPNFTTIYPKMLCSLHNKISQTRHH